MGLLVNDRREFLKLSTDAFPEVDVKNHTWIGAKCLITDTGERYIWDGNGWQPDMEYDYEWKHMI